MLKAEGIEGKYLEYKGLPLVRQGAEIIIGNMADKYYLYLFLMDPNNPNGKVIVQIKSTENNKIIKNDIETGLYEAMDLGYIWLTNALR